MVDNLLLCSRQFPDNVESVIVLFIVAIILDDISYFLNSEQSLDGSVK